MSKTKSAAPGYQTLKAELDNVLQQLQRDDLDVDQALEHYQRGLELIEGLESYLKGAENKLKELKATVNTTAT